MLNPFSLLVPSAMGRLIRDYLPPLEGIMFARTHRAALAAYLKDAFPRPDSRPYMPRVLCKEGSEKYLMTFQPILFPPTRGWHEGHLIGLANAVVRYDSLHLLRRIVSIMTARPPAWANAETIPKERGPPLRFFLIRTGFAAAGAMNKRIEEEVEELFHVLLPFLGFAGGHLARVHGYRQ
jgi:hypothetical protein